MFSVEKTAKFTPSLSIKPPKFSKPVQLSKNDKSFEKSRKKLQNAIEQSSFLSKDASEKRKIIAIVTLNIENETEKLYIYEGQDIYETASNITKKYSLNSDYTTYITSNINAQIRLHQESKRKTHNPIHKPISQITPETLTPKFKRMNNFNEILNNSKNLDKTLRSPRQRTTSPLKSSGYVKQNIENFKNYENSSNLKKTHIKNNIDLSKFLTNREKVFKNEKYIDPDCFLSTNSKFVSSQSNESFNESIRQIKKNSSKITYSPNKSKNKNFKQTVVLSKDLKIIENNIIFLPSAFLSSKQQNQGNNNDMEAIKSINILQKIQLFKKVFN